MYNFAALQAGYLFTGFFCYEQYTFYFSVRFNHKLLHIVEDREQIYSKRVRAGKRTYFFDVRSTRANDYYLTITESRRHPQGDGFTYEKHKIFLYKEDFDKFIGALQESVGHVKTELMPDFDFSQYEVKEEEQLDGLNGLGGTELKWE